MQIPPRPDVPPKKKRSKGVIIASIIGGLFVLGVIGNLTDKTDSSSTPTYSTPATVDTSSGISETDKVIADQTWASQDTATQDGFCQGVDYFGVDQATEIFNETADLPLDEAKQIVSYMYEVYC